LTSVGYGRVRAHLAYGGNLYAVVDLDELGLRLGPQVGSRSSWNLGPGCLEGGREGGGHRDPELYGVRLSKRVSRGRYYGVLLFGSPGRPLLDRSPSGTGSSAHLAYLHHLGEVRYRGGG
jgi:proline racemase